MKVWIHPQTGKIVISWHVYAAASYKSGTGDLVAYHYMGEALENENGITCIMDPKYLEYFDYVGELS